MRKKILLSGIIILVIALGLYTGYLWLQEDVHMKKNSLSYFILFHPDYIKDMSLPEPTKPPRYYYSGGDGVKPSTQEINIFSDTAPEAALPPITEFLEKQEFKQDMSPEYNGEFAYFLNKNFEVHIRLAELSSSTPRFQYVISEYQY